MAASLGLTGGLALETKARRHSWRLFARAAAVVSCSSGLCLLRLPIENSPNLHYIQVDLCEEHHANTRTGWTQIAHTLLGQPTGAADAPAGVGLALQKA